MVTDLDPWYRMRENLVRMLSADLVGSEEDASIDEPPLDRFVMGILYPQAAMTLEEESDVPEAADGVGPDNTYDPAVALSRRQYPSSMGLTVAVVPADTPSINVAVSAARYDEYRASSVPETNTEDAVDETTTSSTPKDSWTRVSPEIDSISVRTDQVGREIRTLVEGLELHILVRSVIRGVAPITLALVNTLEAPAKGRRDEACWFQPEISVSVHRGEFVDRNLAKGHATDKEAGSYALLYRGVRDLAVGHGCSVDWAVNESTVTRLTSTFVPTHAVALADAAGAEIPIAMNDLADGRGLESLESMVESYEDWIRNRRSDATGLDGDLRAAADKHMAEATEAASRMRRGIELIRENEFAAEAFGLMNAAMNLQRYRQDLARSGPEVADATVQQWRPFQMAFILMNLPDLADPESDGRDEVDLLWFPTGGGKTEAYLGLISFVIFLRRLRDPMAGGVSVLMRYTLRLLTIQQFHRAAGLICAMESIRRERLADSARISLGLWVGRGATPNSADEAKSALKLMAVGDKSDKGNPQQLLSCPACGTKLPLKQYTVLTNPDRLSVVCPNLECEFHDGLPVHLIDEDVYRERPSLVIGTVDKFAMMAWKSQTQSLFGSDGSNPPPDLIVQDELHLISGPLGTMVGLYETAVDAACSRGGARPKVIASTATIRRADDQVKAVFNRSARQFPPSGLVASDSYFSVDAPASDKGDRLYVGLMAPGVSHATLMVRAYAAVLQAAADEETDEEVRDAYWTLLGYFNSLRVLGGAFMQVQDDVPDRLKVIATRLGRPMRELDDDTLELTSRIDSTKVPEALERLSTTLPEAPDVVLATNMISVGVDVDRLGLMAVMGQPQATAEYIQATSRVGRKYPGLVLVLYNSARSRDLSHYELFKSYHQALYRQVEATGATPFAARARDRGLHGMFVSLVRQMVKAAAADKSAGKVGQWTADLEEVVDTIVERTRDVASSEVHAVEVQLGELMDAWRAAADNGTVDHFPGWYQQKINALLQDTSEVVDDVDFDYPVDEPPWPTMTSLRDVDATSGLYLVPTKARKDANA